jgi:hypothetical protein
MIDFTISGHFQSLAGGHIEVVTDCDTASIPIGDGRIDASFTAGRVTSVAGYDAAGRQCFEWEVPAQEAIFFSKNPDGNLKLATAASRQ